MILQTLFTRLAPVRLYLPFCFALTPFKCNRSISIPLQFLSCYPILVCRLMLDLHKAAQEDRNPTITYIFSAVEVSDNPVDISGSEDVANELQSGSITLNAIT
ncbi:hypothetical protein K439DRAFT_445788 [Ramaria rubella]|nr:hypothetical protein K439DRAFT_445788 [Ramaria rubella]